ncbi:MAG: phage portal protein [Candidatus Competibacter sp.]
MSKRKDANKTKIERLERQVENLQKRAYDSASTARRVESWKTQNSDPNIEVANGLAITRNRARDLRRNNSYARKIITTWSSNVVGTGIIPTSDDEALLELFNQWADSTDCDANGLTNFWGLQEQIIEAVVESGECLVQKVYDKSKLIPLRLKILEGDHLDHTLTKPKEGIQQGIKFDGTGNRTGYILFKSHPGSEGASTDTITVPAEDLIHVFRIERPNQQRGLTWLAPAIIELRKLKMFQDARLERVSIANLLAGIITDINGDPTETTSDIELSPGALISLPAGKDITFNTPPDPGQTSEFEKSLLRSISSAVGLPYELLSNDFSESNFSSARMSANGFLMLIDCVRWNMFVPQFLDRVWNWFWLTAPLSGLYNAGPEEEGPPKVTWTMPRRILVDLVRELPITIEAIRAGLTTPSEALREFGYNPKLFFEEYKRDMDIIEQLGLVLSSDCRKDAQRLKALSDQQQKTAEPA